MLTLALAALTAAGCGDDDDDGGGGGGADASDALTKVGKGEGQVNLIAWAGYVEDGSQSKVPEESPSFSALA